MADTVYVLTNPAMPGLVKIGFTQREDAAQRIAELYTTGVPVPFEIEFACKVADGPAVEDALQTAFEPNRVNPRREFFRIEPEQAIAILKLLQIEDVTPEVEEAPDNIDAESKAAGEELKRRRPNMNFQEMGIPIGATLNFTQGDSTVIVTGPRKVKFGDEENFISVVTRHLLAVEYDVAPAFYWRYNGRLLRDIYNDTYEPIE